MSLAIKTLVGKLVDVGFKLTTDIQKSGTYHNNRGSSYDAATGTITPSEITAAINFTISAYNEKDSGSVDAMFGDEVAVIKFAVLEAAGITQPTEKDTISTPDGMLRQVVGYTLDPTRQLLVCQVRKIGS